MTDTSRTPSDAAGEPRDAPPDAPGGDEHVQPKAGGWRTVPVLGWTLGLSALVHLALVVPAVLFVVATPEKELDLEWFGEFERLVAVGHGRAQGTWADVDAAPERPRQTPEAVVDEPVVDEPAAEEPVVDEPAPEESVVDEPAAEEPVVDESSAPEPPPAPTPPPRRSELIPVRPQPERKVESRPEPAKPTTPEKSKEPSNPFVAADGLPALDRGGPSELPDLRHYGPGNARMTALVRVDRLRNTQFEEGARRLLSAVPDYRILLESTGLDPVRELDSIFMASANPRYLQETFLAVRHSMTDPALKNVLERRFPEPLPWERRGRVELRRLVPADGQYKDPRQILLARPGLAIVTRPEWLSELTEGVAEDSPLAGEATGTVVTLVDGLEHIERAAERDDTLVLLSAHGLYFMLPGVGRLPRFEAVRLAITNPAAPTLDIDLHFANEAMASRFADSCPSMAKKVLGSIPRLPGIAGLVERIECRSDGRYVNVHGEYSAREVATILQFATLFVPRPPALASLPAAPPAAVPEPPTGAAPETEAAPASDSAPPRDAGSAPETEVEPASEPVPTAETEAAAGTEPGPEAAP